MELEYRAFATVKAEAKTAGDVTTITGTASTPTVDAHETTFNPLGARYKLPIPLMWHHDTERRGIAVGRVEFAQASEQAIKFRAVLPHIHEEGDLKRAVDLAIHSLKYGLVRGVSIGFRPIRSAIERLKSGVTRFNEWDWHELSLVQIPSNMDATIDSVRSICLGLAASGNESRPVRLDFTAGVSAQSRNYSGREANSVNIQEQIRGLEAKHGSNTERQRAIFAKAGAEGRTTDAQEQDELKTLASECDAVQTDLQMLRTLERQAIPKAVAVAGNGSEQAMTTRAGASFLPGRPVVPKGTGFIRYAMAIATNPGSKHDAVRFAARWKDSTPEVYQALEMRADPGTVTDAAWASPLAVPQNLASEFVELLRAQTVLGRLALRRVPFNVDIPVQTSGSTVNWVGEAAVKPVGELAFTTAHFGHSKVAGIVVISEELARLSSPSAEATVSEDLRNAVSEFIDQQFLSESVAATANNPAGIARGVTATPATGTDAASLRCDIGSALGAMTSAGLSTAGVAIVMSEQMASQIALMTNALGQPDFATMGANGGTLAGHTVITSGNVVSDTTGQNIYFIKQNEVFLADDGAVSIDSSREATLDMSGSTSAVYSLWQRNSVGIRAERWINYARRREGAVQYISGAAYNVCGS